MARARVLSALGRGAQRLLAPARAGDRGAARLSARLRALPRSSSTELLRAAGGDLALQSRLPGLLRFVHPPGRRTLRSTKSKAGSIRSPRQAGGFTSSSRAASRRCATISPDIVRLVRARGFDFVQLNSNGVRLARDRDFVNVLAGEGLDCVFLQFDGVSDAVYQQLRGAKLMRLKQQAVENCAEAGLGVVLTPTLVPGVNVGEIGAIVDFARARLPAVRAVHFQPVSYFGRRLAAPDAASRITLPEVMQALIDYSGGTIRFEDFRPGSAENPYCSFSGRFRVDEAGRLSAMAEPAPSCCSPPSCAGKIDVLRFDAAQPRGGARASICGGSVDAAGPRRRRGNRDWRRSMLSSPAASARSGSPAWRSRMPGRSTRTGCDSATSMSSRPTGGSSRSAPTI